MNDLIYIAIACYSIVSFFHLATVVLEVTPSRLPVEGCVVEGVVVVPGPTMDDSPRSFSPISLGLFTPVTVEIIHLKLC